jgi:hypothetical protein
MWSKPRIYAHRAEQFRVTQRDISEEQSWITGPPSDPPKNGCRTFPSADLARYSISARNLGSTKCLCEQCAWRKVASSGRAARASPADPRPRLYRSHGPRCRRRRGGRPSAGRRRARPICSHRARSQRWSGSPAARRSSSPSRSSAPSDIGCRGPSNDALQPEPAGVREHLAAVDLEAFAEQDVSPTDDLVQSGLATSTIFVDLPWLGPEGPSFCPCGCLLPASGR